MINPNFTAQSESLNFNSTVEAIVKRSCIIDYGIIQEIVADGVVNVAVAVSDTDQNMFCMTCVLANIASSSLTIDVKPSEGDRVLVVYPRMYDDDMFSVPDDDTKKNVIVNPKAKGYNLCSGIAILINQYKEASHKNIITVDNGAVNLKLGYDKDNDKYMTELTTRADGNITVKNPNATVTIDKDGNVTMQAKGKYTIANDVTDLKQVIDGLATELENLVTIGSETTQSTSPATKTSIATWRTGKLNNLLDEASD